LRIAAELENYRKRAAKDVAEASRGAKERVLRELLPVIDLLSKAAEAADKASDAHAVAEGVRMIVRQFEDVTGKMGVARVKTTGLPFDPNFHEAVSQVTVSGQPAGSVVAEVEAGYTWDGRLLRAAKVVVAAEEG
jgi:molecular chaperone GrpE